MPVYLFSFHAYRSWMPDHRRGYVRRGVGIKSADAVAAALYAARAKKARSVFDSVVQKALTECGRIECERIGVCLHAAATEPGHLHLLVSWKHDRAWLLVRTSIKTALTRHLNSSFPGIGFSRGGSRKRIRNVGHFNYLMREYLPKHRGWGWYEGRGWVAPRK